MTFEIREVANGWMITPSNNYDRSCHMGNHEIFVFNDFKDVMAFLRSKSPILSGDKAEKKK